MKDNEMQNIADNIHKLAHAITTQNTLPGTDAAGGSVDSLTEAVMGVTAGLLAIATAIDGVSEALYDMKQNS